MTRDELQETMEDYGNMKLVMSVSDILPDDVPRINIAGMLFVLLEDGMVSFYAELTPSGHPQLLPTSMQHGEPCAAYWRLASHNFHEFEKAVPVDEMNLLVEAQRISKGLSRTKLAALAKRCLLELGDEHLSLGELDAITDGDPELV
jgi:hypothetical protein